MNIEVRGNRNGKKILCLPGVFMSGDCFYRLSEYMEEYCMVLVTYNSHDDQKKEFKSFAYEMFTLENGLKKLHMTDFDMIVGLSIGGIMAIELMRRGRIQAKKVFVDGVKTCVPVLKRTAYCRNVILMRLFTLWAKTPAKGINLLKKTYSKDWADRMQRNAAYFSFSSLKNLMWDYNRYKLSKEITFPVKYLYGGLENKRNIRKLFRLYPDADVIVKSNYYHLGYLDKEPAAYAALLKEYMDK